MLTHLNLQGAENHKLSLERAALLWKLSSFIVKGWAVTPSLPAEQFVGCWRKLHTSKQKKRFYVIVSECLWVCRGRDVFMASRCCREEPHPPFYSKSMPRPSLNTNRLHWSLPAVCHHILVLSSLPISLSFPSHCRRGSSDSCCRVFCLQCEPVLYE